MATLLSLEAARPQAALTTPSAGPQHRHIPLRPSGLLPVQEGCATMPTARRRFVPDPRALHRSVTLPSRGLYPMGSPMRHLTESRMLNNGDGEATGANMRRMARQ